MTGKGIRTVSVLLVALGFVSLFYGVTIMMVGSGTWFFAFWYVLGAILLTAGWCVHVGVWAALPNGLRYAGVGCLAVLAVAFAVTGAFVASGFGQQGEDDLDYVVVLGAQVRDDGPSMVLRYRLDAAAQYLQQNPRTICIVSGGQGANEPVAEAVAMAAYLEDQGIDASRIIQEGLSSNTAQNIGNSMAFFDADTDRVGIITNDFHVFRATAIARKQGIQHVCGIAAESVPWYLPNNFVRETLGVVKDLAAGNI